MGHGHDRRDLASSSTAPPASAGRPDDHHRPGDPHPRSAAEADPEASGPIAWPARNGFTVVLASIPARGTGHDDAAAKAKLALSRGLRVVGILDSVEILEPPPRATTSSLPGSTTPLERRQTAARRVDSGAFQTRTPARSRARTRCNARPGRGCSAVAQSTCPFATATSTRLCNTPRKGVDWAPTEQRAPP